MKSIFRSVITVAALASLTVPAIAQEDLEALIEGKPSATDTPSRLAVSGIVRLFQYSIGNLGGPQLDLIRAMERGAWDEALIQYNPAVNGTKFKNSVNDTALRGFIEYKAGLPMTGIETLFTVTQPENIDRELMRQWMEMAPPSSPVWTHARIQWTPAWAKVMPPEVEIRVRSARLNGLKDVEGIRQLMIFAPEGSAERAQLQWKLAVALSLNDQADEAAKQLAPLFKLKNPPVSVDLLNLTAARLLYQRSFFEASAKYDEKIPKGSDHWTQAQEEMAWAYVRKGEPQNALAVTKSLVNPALGADVGPETFFLRSLSELKVCDYSGAVETLSEVPKRFKTRTLALEKLSQDPSGPAVDQLLKSLREGKAKSTELGKVMKDLPRFSNRDERLQQLVQAEQLLEKEAARAEVIYARTLALTGLQGHFEKMRQDLQGRLSAAKASSRARVQELAQREVKDTKQLLQKMHIVEAEVLQQVSLVDKIAKGAGGEVREMKGSTGSKSATALRFPAESETWFDEISNYKIDVRKGCQVKR